MNLQIKKLNDSELESISGGKHKQISILSFENVRLTGFHPTSNQTYSIDNNGNYHVTTIYTDKEWVDKLKAEEAIRKTEEKENTVTLCVGASVCAAVVVGSFFLLIKRSRK